MLKVGDPAPDVVLTDLDGREVALASLWQQQPTLLVFLRHFG
jgi:peroxiredoxin